jgi:histidyl-tRNA synthetase
VAIIGPEEIEKNVVTLKNMQSGEQQVYNIENLWSLPALKLT